MSFLRTQTSSLFNSNYVVDSSESIFSVIIEGSYSKLDKILSRNPYEINQIDTLYNYTPLHVAVDCGNINMVLLLLSFKPDLKRKDRYGQTPFDLAVKNRNKEIVEMITKAQDTTTNTELTRVKNDLKDMKKDYDKLLTSTMQQTDKYNKELNNNANLKLELGLERTSNKRLREEVTKLEGENTELRTDVKRLKTSNEALVNASRKK